MSIQLTINNTSLLKKKINFEEMIKELNLEYGAYNDFSVLEKKKFYNKLQCLLFNPSKIGIGIFFDGSKINKGSIIILLQTFTTNNEIDLFYKIVKYICDKYIKINLYLNDELIEYDDLIILKDKIIELAVSNLNLGCKRTIDYIKELRLALYPLMLSDEQRDKFGYCINLDEFEEFIHSKQKDNICFSYPKLEEDKAYYYLKVDTISIFPINDTQLPNKNQINNIYINMLEDGINYSYFDFIKLFEKNEKYDENHIIISKLTKEEIKNIIKILKEN